MLEQLIIKDAPCLSRLLFHGHGDEEPMNILVISAPNLEILGPLCAVRPGITFDAGATIQGSSIFRSHMRSSVKVLAFKDMNLSLDVVIEFMRCFPCLEELFISTKYSGKKNEWRHRRDLDKDLDIRLKKIVVRNYRGNQSHVDFAKFFVLNAAVLESMRLELITEEYSTIEEQPTLLHLNERASIGAQFDFVPYVPEPGSPYQHIHDLSTADPFERYPYWN
uniref:Uncharacterized protein n=1 Tax=Arundo donax TaxID=35708 RepID=A0A0A9B412_ARUDO